MLPDLKKAGTQENRLYLLVMDDRETETWIYFTQERGGTWSNWDNKMFRIIGDYIGTLAMTIILLVGLVSWAALRAIRRRRRQWPSKRGYSRLDDRDDKPEESYIERSRV